jgi:hypothetical protein
MKRGKIKLGMAEPLTLTPPLLVKGYGHKIMRRDKYS